MSSVFCLTNNGTQGVRILNKLQRAGFSDNSISVMHSDPTGNLTPENSTKAPEGATAGTGAGAILGGAVGWLAGAGTVAIPGLGALLAVGPIFGALSGVAVGGTLGGLTGALIGMGIPEYEAEQYERCVRNGKALISVHADNREQVALVRTIMSEENGEAISTGNESATSSR